MPVKRPFARKHGLTLTQHEELGRELAEIRARLAHLCITISHAYPHASPVGRQTGGSTAPKPCQAIDALRQVLENEMLTEHKANPKATTKVYWPAGASDADR